MFDGLSVIDADSHKMENPLVFFDYLEPPYRDRLSSKTDRYGQQRLVIYDFNPSTGRNDLERVFPQPDGPGKGAFAAIHPETAIGGMRLPSLIDWALVIQRRRLVAVLGTVRAPSVRRSPISVRFGPIFPAAITTP